jgi:hypothetical protein
MSETTKEDDYDPWETVSGTPFLSPAQREYYNKNRKNTFDDFKNDPMYDILPVGTWSDFETFRRYDLKHSKSNPVLIAISSGREHIQKISYAQYSLKCEFEKGLLSEAYAKMIELHLEVEKMGVMSDFNLSLKPVYKRLKKQRDENRKLSLTEDDTPPVEEDKMTIMVIDEKEEVVDKITGDKIIDE